MQQFNDWEVAAWLLITHAIASPYHAWWI